MNENILWKDSYDDTGKANCSTRVVSEVDKNSFNVNNSGCPEKEEGKSSPELESFYLGENVSKNIMSQLLEKPSKIEKYFLTPSISTSKRKIDISNTASGGKNKKEFHTNSDFLELTPIIRKNSKN